MQILLKTTVVECTQQSGSNVLAPKSLKYLKLSITIDEMFDLRPVNA